MDLLNDHLSSGIFWYSLLSCSSLVVHVYSLLQIVLCYNDPFDYAED